MADNDWMKYAGLAIEKGWEGYDKGYKLQLARDQAIADREDKKKALKYKQLEELNKIVSETGKIPEGAKKSGYFDPDVLAIYESTEEKPAQGIINVPEQPTGMLKSPTQGLITAPQKDPDSYGYKPETESLPVTVPQAEQAPAATVQPQQAANQEVAQQGFLQQPSWQDRYQAVINRPIPANNPNIRGQVVPGVISKFSQRADEKRKKDLETLKLESDLQQKIDESKYLPGKLSAEAKERAMKIADEQRKARLAQGQGNTNEKLAGLDQGRQQKVNDLRTALLGFYNVKNAILAGDTYAKPEIMQEAGGSTPFETSADQFGEGYARYRTGANFTKEEGKRFQKRLPKLTDKPAQAFDKLNKVQTELESALKTYGFTPQEFPEIAIVKQQSDSLNIDSLKKKPTGVVDAIKDYMKKEKRKKGLIPDKVRVRDVDGSEVLIPRERLDEAIKDGATPL